MNRLLNDGLTYLNYILFTVWFVWGAKNAIRSDRLMEATVAKFDRHREFAYRLGVTFYGLRSNHEKITPKFLTEWDFVYRGYWKRAWWHFALLPIFGLLSGVVRYQIDILFYRS